MSALFAFLHHVAAFLVFGTLLVELVLLRGELTKANAEKLLRADLIFGASAGVLLAVGVLRVYFFEKGAEYYTHSIPFILKVSLFVAVGLVSIYPTREFLSWRPALKQGTLPAVDAARMARLRFLVHLELTFIVAIILFAALMARGIGSV